MTDDRSERLRQRLRRRQQRVEDHETYAPGWGCGIADCSYVGDSALDLITHQTQDHPPHTCKVCDRDVPDGFMAIYHTFNDHSRTEYVKAYDASPDDVRLREEIKAAIERQLDVPALLEELQGEAPTGR